nr:FAD binding domain-containing protein [uncultured Oscillibacter sp.]
MNVVSYHRPQGLDALYTGLEAENAPILWMAGGTDVLVQARKPGRFDDRAVFDLTALPSLQAIEEREDALVIGSGATHGQIADSPLVRRFAPPLAQACAQVGAQQLRNRATLGGNIANASPAGDTLAPLAALNASVELDRLGRRRRVPLTGLILAPGRTALEEREFIRALWIPKLPEGARSGFLKIGRRRALAISRLTLAAVLVLGAEEKIRELRLSVGAVFPRPMRFAELEEGARGLSAEDGCLEEIARALSEKIPEIAGRRTSTAYKQPVCRLACLRLLKELRDG